MQTMPILFFVIYILLLCWMLVLLCGTIQLFIKRRGDDDKLASDLADNVDKNTDASRRGTIPSTDPGYEVEDSGDDGDDSLDSPLIGVTRMNSVDLYTTAQHSNTTLGHRRSLHTCDE
jgi:hypothetical protein